MTSNQTLGIGSLVTSNHGRVTLSGSLVWQIQNIDTDLGIATIVHIAGDDDIERHNSIAGRLQFERLETKHLRAWTADIPWWAADTADILGVERPEISGSTPDRDADLSKLLKELQTTGPDMSGEASDEWWAGYDTCKESAAQVLEQILTADPSTES